MAKPAQKSKTTKSRTGKRRTGTPAAETTQIVLTLSGPDGEIVQVEKLGKSGQRQKLSRKELADLFDGADEDEFDAALDEAYSTGVSDAMHHAW
jgi:hypothetical protein